LLGIRPVGASPAGFFAPRATVRMDERLAPIRHEPFSRFFLKTLKKNAKK